MSKHLKTGIQTWGHMTRNQAAREALDYLRGKGNSREYAQGASKNWESRNYGHACEGHWPVTLPWSTGAVRASRG